MRRLIFRVLVLLLMVGFLIFAPTRKSEAVSCDGSCYQACYAQYRECLLTNAAGDCCLEFNECHQACGTCVKCDMPVEYP
jgi:hypothetical protein